ncbi:hypothetical protein [Geopsychrobacter electrodiphilus]|uniref:hypothetical protein n=1 Tax=Geopsychrobacter electrodiphilus TaxID=225196 RepID=UPI000361BE6D|nr:hypothetical protein [Geopsychrobacter electrodiphilus]
MRNTPKTKGELVIEQIMQQLDPASPRYRVLSVACQFKSSWVELGQQLSLVRKAGEYSSWGYASFEDYCRDEVRIKKDTAFKLTGAYNYLEAKEPEILARSRQMLTIPDYRSIDMLRQASEGQNLSDEQFQLLRETVIDKERSHPTVARQFRELSGQNSQQTEPQLVKASLGTARRLESLLQQLPNLPADVLAACSKILDDLQQQAAQFDPETEGSSNHPNHP